MSLALGDRPAWRDWRKDGECQLYHIEIQERGILEHLVNPAPSSSQMSLANQSNRAKSNSAARSAPPVRSSKLANKNVSVIARASKKK